MQKRTTRGRRSSGTVPLHMLFRSPLLCVTALGLGGRDRGPGLDATSLWWWWDYALACWVGDQEIAVDLLQIHAANT